MNKTLGYVDDVDFLAGLKLRQDSKSAEKVLKEALADGRTSEIYENIHSNINKTVAGSGAAEEKTPDGLGYSVEYGKAHKLLTELISIQLETEDGSKNSIPDMGRLLGSLLTDEEIDKLYREAANIDSPEDDPYIDTDPRDFNVHIGESTGTTDIYNDGSINIVQDNGDLTAKSIVSEREDVVIEVKDGSILAGDNGGKENILAVDTKLTASGSIGSESAPLLIEQRPNAPLLVPGVDEDPYFDDDYVSKLEGYDGSIPAFDNDLEDKEYVLRLVELVNEDGEKEMKWILDVVVRHDWIREDYPEQAGRLDAEAAQGDVFIAQPTGDTGIGQLIAENGKVSLESDGDVIDARSEEISADEPNVKSDTAEIVSQNGQIGTGEEPIEADIEDKARFEAEGDINVDAQDSLEAEADSIDGKLNISAEDDLTLSNTDISAGGTGDMLIEDVSAGGTVHITSNGDIIGEGEGENTEISADDIILNADGDIGTGEDPLRVDSAAGDTGNGTVSAEGENIYLLEQEGDLAAEDISGSGDVEITVPDGSILDTTDSKYDEAAQAQKEADTAKNHATSAEALLESERLQNEQAEQIAREAEDKRDEALRELEEVREQNNLIDEVLSDDSLSDEEKYVLIGEIIGDGRSPEDLERLERELEDEYNELSDEAEKARETADKSSEEVMKAKDEAEKARDKAEQLQDKADRLMDEAANTDPAISSGEDMKLDASENIGSKDDPLDISAGGTVDAQAGGDVNIAHNGDMTIGDISGDDVGIIADGDIAADKNGNGIEADDHVFITSGGDIGSGDSPLDLDADSLSGSAGDDAFINAEGDLTVDQFTAKDELDLDVEGELKGGDAEEGAANITAGDMDLSAGGDIGEEDDHLVVDPDGLSAEGEDMWIDILGDVVIGRIDGDDVDLDVSGRLDGDEGDGPHIDADNLYIDADNGVGSEDRPLIIYVPGIVEINSLYGEVWYRNLFQLLFEDLGQCHCMDDFWTRVVRMIIAAEEGAVIEVDAEELTRMPEKVMKALRERSDVTLIIHWDGGETIVINAGTALELDEENFRDNDNIWHGEHICYTLQWLEEYYGELNAAIPA